MVSQLQIPTNNINNLVDPSQWTTLSNLGNVYADAQAKARKQAALASLGTDPQSNMATLLTSQDPALAQTGLNLQQKVLEQQREDARYRITDARANAQLGIQQAAAHRAQEDWEQAEKDRQDAAKAMGALFQGGAPAAAPFPAPLPGQTPAPPSAAPPVAASLPVAPPPSAAPVQPSSISATPPAPELQPPPIKAEGGDELPAWASDQSLTGRIATNLLSPNPPAAAGINRDQIAALYANPLTRPLAAAFLQKQFDPGTWTYHFDNNTGRVIGTNSKTQEVKDVTPPTGSGGPPPTKQQQEYQGYFQAGKDLKMTDEQARAFAANKGKTPSSDDLHPDERKQVNTLTSMVDSGERVLQNINDLKDLSKKAWGFPGAETASSFGSTFLPEKLGGAGATATQELINAAHTNVTESAKAAFGARITNLDLKVLQDLQSSANQPNVVRQPIIKRAADMINDKIKAAKREADAIRDKTFYKPGGGAAPAGNKPSLDELIPLK